MVENVLKYKPLRILALMEADRITGPAKNLLRFGESARLPQAGLPPVDLHVATYLRSGLATNKFLEAAQQRHLSSHGIAERGRFDPSVIGGIRRLVETVQPDIIQTHNTKSHFLLRCSGCWRDRPWIAFNHGYTTEDLKMRVYNQLDRWSLRIPRLVITMCQPFAQALKENGVDSGRIEILPNSIEAPRELREGEVQAFRERWKLKSSEAVLIAIGRLSSEKGHRFLLEALSAPELRDRAWRLLVAGDGIEAAHLKQQAAQSGIAGRIEWMGLVEDVRPLYAVSDLFILPSLSEGSPNVLLEAMAAGNTIVSTAVGGVPEMVRHEEHALLVQPGQARPLTEAVARLLKDRDEATRLAAAAQKHAQSFSPLTYRTRLCELYGQLLNLPAT